MRDVDRDKQDLIEELEQLRQQINRLQASEVDYRKTEESYRLLITNATEGITVAQEGKIKFANPKFSELTGYTIDEIISMSPMDMVHPDDLDTVKDYYTRRLRGEAVPESYTFRIIDKSGNVKWLERKVASTTWEGNPASLVFTTDVTQRMSMEQALRESEAKYRDLADSIADVFFAMDEDLRYTYWNKASEELTGIPAKDAIGKNIFDLFSDDESTRRMVNFYRRALATNEPQRTINERALNGRNYVFDISAYPTKGGICVYVKDITERKKLEKALEESERWYRLIFDNTPIGIGFASLDGKVVNANKAMAAITGYAAEDLDKINVSGLYINITDRDLFLRKLKEQGSVIDYPLRLRHKDGTEYDALLTSKLVSIGDMEFVQTILHDVTESKQAQEKLRESEERYRSLVELSPEAIFVAVEGKHVFTNSAGLKLLGSSSPNEIIGKPIMDVIHPSYRQLVSQRIKEAMTTGESAPTMEEKFLRLDGTEIDVEVRAAPLVYKGKPAMQVVIRDITERKQAEEALRLSEQNFRHSIENSPLGIRIVDADGNTIYANRVFLDIHGYGSIEELEPVPRQQRYTAQSYKEHHERTAKRKRGELVPNNYEISIVRKDGQVRHLTVSRGEVLWNGEQQFQVVYQDITERKRAEEESRTIIRTAMDGFWLTDMDGRLTDVNEAYCQLTGYTRDELLAMSISDIEATETSRDTFRRIQKIKEIGFDRFETHHRCRNGEVVDVEVSVNYLPGGNGRLVVFIRDITERKKAEEALRASEARYRLLAENASDVIWTADLNLKMNYISPSCINLHGYTAEEAMKLPLEKAMTSESYVRVISLFNTGLADYAAGRVVPGRIRSFEAEFIRKDGSTVWAETMVTFIRDAEGRPVGVQGVTRNIDERKRAEEALRTSEARYRLLAENVRDVIWSTDMGLRFTYVSPSIKYLGDRTAEEVMTMSLERLLTPPSRELAMKTFAEELATAKIAPVDPNRSRTLEVEFVRRDGSLLWAELKMNFIRGPDAQPVGILGVMRDISERKKAESERREFEQKAQLTSHLASVGELASGVAHEINNPLTGVIGYAELLMQEDVPEHIKDDLGVIHDGAQRVASIVKGLLKFARQTRPEQVPVNINEIIEVSLRLRAYELETNNIKVVTVLSTRLPLTVADPGQLQQVFLNLTINAETEMKLARGKGKLVIQTEHINDIIRISFKDNGPGIARKNLKKIFDPFFTTREVGKGTGLGLSICHGIISGHGGKIYAESKLGKGATFIVELPVISQHKQVIKRSKSPGKPIGARKARILVVDDEAVVRQLLSQLLKKEGYSVETFDNGREALSRIKKDGYDLILLDVKLPGMSGSEVYERIREISVSLTKRVVFITGDVMGADTESFLARTKAPFIAKPFNLENLKEQIISLLADKHAGNVTRSKPRAKSKKRKAKARK